MSTTKNHCFICGGTNFDKCTDEYYQCQGCGHETLVESQTQGYILNDPLTEKDSRRVTALDRFKSRILIRFETPSNKEQLLDIGSASGKFLFQNASRYRRAYGVEITPKAIDFSRNVLHLDIKNNIQDVPAGISMATAWHSLEHIPETALLEVLSVLSGNMVDGGRLIVSVPNGASYQYHWFGRAYAYFDVPNHLHQFTIDSLEKLLAKFGFHHLETVNSWPYNTFGYTQGLLNIITNTHNYLYYRLKRRSRKPSLPLDILHIALLPIVLPVGYLLAIVDKTKSKYQGVITSCFEKNPS